MFYYEVAPSERSYQGKELLTYDSATPLNSGQIIVVKVRTKHTLGFVVRKVQKPSFKTKPIDRIIDARLPAASLKLFEWMRLYYPAPLGLTASNFLPPALDIKKLKPLTDKPETTKKPALPSLTLDQTSALKSILDGSSSAYILHGDTGTGKTRVYIELIRASLTSGKSAYVLTPEISLTPQLVNSLETVFSNVIVTHSGMTDTERRDAWLRVQTSSEPIVIVGPRSALFLPASSVGLIIIDEFHETAYKQEQAPHYHAVRVASTLAGLHSAKLVLGSATPPINDYYYASQKSVPVIRMTDKPLDSNHPVTQHVVDLANSDETTKHPLVTRTLLAELTACLERGEQAMLFLNKRGHARLIVCQSCGWRAECDRCNIPYVYHQDGHRLQCHTCGQQADAPNSCPSCGSSEIIFKSPGTKAVADHIIALFPDATVARFDRDNKKSERLDQHYEKLQSGEIDIVIGTQLLAKGHDLPRLSLVGILLADTELQFPDYASEERSYQLIHQLAGRVGRGHRAGHIVIQTYNPSSPIIEAADHTKSHWQDFYEAQLETRKAFGFPPFYHTLKIEVARARSDMAAKAAEQIADHLTQLHTGIEIIGPAPRFIAKQNNKWQWQLIVKAKNRSKLTAICENLPIKCTYDIDPVNLL